MRVQSSFFFQQEKMLTYDACRSRPFYRVIHLKKMFCSLVAQLNFLTPMSTKVLHCSENILGAWPGSFFFLTDNLNKSVSSRSTQNHSSSQTTDCGRYCSNTLHMLRQVLRNFHPRLQECHNCNGEHLED